MGKLIIQILTTSCLLFTTKVYAQSLISGKVLDKDDEPLPYANVLLFQTADTTFLKGGVTNSDGEFQIRYDVNTNFSKNPAFYIQIDFMGYTRYQSEVFQAAYTVNLGAIVLQENAKMLREVTITGEKPLFEQKIDRTVVNVQNSITSAGNNVLNILGKSPSVTVNRATNEITLMGKQSVLVMIDNHQIRMEPADLMHYLESLPAENINSIELITAPPASYDAQGNAGIININTIKRQNEGLIGRFTANTAYGERFKFGGSVNLSLKKEKLYAFANISGNMNYDVERVALYMDYAYTDRNIISDMSVLRKPNNRIYIGELGIDYNLTNKTTIGALLNVNGTDWKMNAVSETAIEDSNTGSSHQLVKSYEENIALRTLLNFNLQHTFTEASSFKFDYDHIWFTRNNPTNYYSTTMDDTGTEEVEEFISDSGTPLSIHVLKADYKQAIFDKVSMEAGLKSTLSSFTNDVRVAYKEDETFVDNTEFTDIFKMDEYIYAAYASLDWQLLPTLLLKSGLRFEKYDMKLGSDNEGNILDRSSNNFFPSVYLSFNPNENHEWNVSYVERIERPGFLNLAPYFYFFNPKTLFTGNPNLIPATSTQYKIDYRLKSLNVSLQYTDIDHPVFNWQPGRNDQLLLAVFRPEQGLESKIVSFTAMVPWEINNWWSSRYSFSGYHTNQTPVIHETDVNRKNYSYNITTTHNFKLFSQLELEINGVYNSPYYEGVAVTANRPELNIGILKKFASGASLSLNVNDVFDSSSQWPIKADLTENGAFYDWIFDAEGPIYRINFSIPFGNKQIQERDKRNTGSEEEQQRLN